MIANVAIKTFLALVVAFFLATGSVAFLVSCYFSAISSKSHVVSDTLVEIPFGSSLRRVSTLLSEAGVITDASQFYWYLRIGRTDGTKIQAGFYNFNGEITPHHVADRLLLGRDQSYKLTFKEGQSLVELATAVEAMGLATKEEFAVAMISNEVGSLIAAPRFELRKALENDMGGIEGYLFPDTYFFSKRDNAHSIIRKMHAKLMSIIDDEIRARMKELSLTLHEVLTLASIIEKETGDPKERPIIASVYQNRLKVGMRLQADPTVIYGIKNYEGKIHKSDLLAHHPYNTYTITGLPPGPISSVGKEAIRAVLWPQETKYLYFVSKNDGTHVFCENLTCHNEAVRKWQIEFFRRAKAAKNIQR